MTHPIPPRDTQPESIDDIEDRMGSMEQLSFDKERDDDRRIGDEVPEEEYEQRFPPERVREAGLTAGSVADHQPTADDLSPETLIDESGARSPREPGTDEGPIDKEMHLVGENSIGGGNGMDEAELGRARPLDGKPWDGPADAQLQDAELVEDESVLSDRELAGDAPLDSARYIKPEDE